MTLILKLKTLFWEHIYCNHQGELIEVTDYGTLACTRCSRTVDLRSIERKDK